MTLLRLFLENVRRRLDERQKRKADREWLRPLVEEMREQWR